MVKGEDQVSTKQSTVIPASKGAWLSVDIWAVIVALVLALMVRFDILKNVPW